MQKRYLTCCLCIAFQINAKTTNDNFNDIDKIVVVGANPLSQLSDTRSIIGQTQ